MELLMMIPKEVYVALTKSGSEWAECHCTASQLEDQLKPLLSSLSIEAKNVAEVNSMAEAKDIAQSASVYRDAIRDANNARKEANLAKVRYEATKSYWEATRTAESTARAANMAAP
jgi:hypothetical protein